jgi:fibronectin-binding autotransporter adhesin
MLSNKNLSRRAALFASVFVVGLPVAAQAQVSSSGGVVTVTGTRTTGTTGGTTPSSPTGGSALGIGSTSNSGTAGVPVTSIIVASTGVLDGSPSAGAGGLILLSGTTTNAIIDNSGSMINGSTGGGSVITYRTGSSDTSPTLQHNITIFNRANAIMRSGNGPISFGSTASGTLVTRNQSSVYNIDNAGIISMTRTDQDGAINFLYVNNSATSGPTINIINRASTSSTTGIIEASRTAIRTGTATIENFGIIRNFLSTNAIQPSGTNGAAIDFRGNDAVGTVINRAGGLIEGQRVAIAGAGAANYVAGVIATANFNSVQHITITNEAGATIRARDNGVVDPMVAGSGVSAAINSNSGVTVNNAGVIESLSATGRGISVGGIGGPNSIFASTITLGSTSTLRGDAGAISLTSAADPNDTVNIEAGATITGNINVGGGNDTINLSGAGNGALSSVLNNAETLNVNSANWTLTGNSNIAATTIASGASLSFGNGGTSGFVDGAITNNGALIINRSDAVTQSATGLISGTGSLQQAGTGSFILAAGNSYTGDTNVTAGTLQAGAAGALASGSAHNVSAGATLDLNSFNHSIISLAGAGNVTLGSAILTVNGATNTLFSGIISGSGGLTRAGTGTLTLSGANSYTGATDVQSGTLSAGAANSFSSVSDLTVAGGATANLGGFSQTVDSLSGAGSVALGAGTLTITGSDNTTFSGNIAGTGGLTQAGTGTTTLSGTNGYTGATNITGGTLTAGGANALAAGSVHNVAAAGTLNTGNTAQTVGGLAGAGAVVTDGNVLTINTSGNSADFSGAITGTGGLTVIGGGTQTLSGTNTYTGTTNVASATLVNSGALAGAITATGGTVTNNGTGVTSVTLASNSTYTGTGAISGSVSAVGSAATLDGNVGGGVTADNSNVTINAAVTGAVALSNSATVTNNSTAGIGSATIASGSTLAGSGNVAGTVDVQNTGTLTGGQTIAGTVNVADGGVLAPGSSGIGTLNVGALNLSGNSILNFDFGAPNLAAGIGADFINVTNNLTLDGILNINNTGSMGPGVYRLFSYGGTLTDNALSFGTIPPGLMTSDFVIQTSVAGEINIISNGTPGLGAPPALQFWDGDVPTNFNNSAVNGGSGIWSTTGAPSWSLANGTSNNVWGGGFAVFQGTAGSVTIDSSVDATGLQFTSNGYVITGGTLNLTDPISIVRIDDAANTATIASVVGGAGNLTLRGAGTLILSGANTNTGATAIEGGTLRVEGGQALSDSAAVTITSPGRLQLGGNETIGGLMGSGSVDLGANALTLANSSNANYAGNISGTGGVTFAGTASQTLSGTNSYTGATQVNSGTLRAGSTSAFGSGSSVSVASGATLDLAGFNTSVGILTGAGNLTLGSAALRVGGTNSSSTFAGVISGTGSVNHVGTGTLTLSGANSYSGGTTVSQGTLAAGAAGVFGTGAMNVASGATLDLAGFNNSVGALTGAGTVALGAGTLTANTGAAGATFAGTLTGTGGFTMAGTGVQTLSGVNSYTGATTVNSGTLRAGSTGALGAGAVTVASGATLDLAGFATTLQTLNGTGSVAIGAGALTVGANNSSSSFAGVISGPGSLTQTGTGTFTISGANTYTGATNVNGGTLRAGAVNTLGAGSANVASGATLDLAGFNNRIGGLNGAGAVTLGAGMLTLGTGNTSGSFSGIISGAGGVTMTGTGTQVLSGTNSYTGGTNVNGGILRAGSTAAFGAGPVTVATGSTLDLAGFNNAIGVLSGSGNVTLGSAALTLGGTSSSSAFAGIISGTGIVNHTGTGTLTLSGTNTYSGGTNVNAGTIALGSASALGTGPVAVASGATLSLAGQNVSLGAISGAGNIALGAGTLTLTGSRSSTFAGAITGTGGVISNNTGTTTLSGANSYTGATTINSGIFTNTGSLASTVTVNGGRFVNNGSTSAGIIVNTGGTYQGTGSVGTAIFNGIVAPGNSIGTTTVNGNATFAATSTYQVEVDQTGASDRLNATGNIVINGGTVQVLGAAETPTARYSNANRYTILSAGGTVTGTFTTLTNNLAFLTPSLTYNSNSVVLNLLRNDVTFAGTAVKDNQRAVAAAIDAAGGSSPFYSGLLGLSAADAPAAFDQLSGEFYASAPTALYRENSDIRRSILTHQSRSEDLEGIQFWFNYLDSDSDQTGANVAKVDRSARGFILGVDKGFGAVRVGIAAAQVDSDLNAANLSSSGETSSQYFSAYVGGDWDGFTAKLGISHGQHDLDISRSIAVPSVNDATTAKLKGNSTQVYGELGYVVVDKDIRLEPFAGFAFQVSNFGGASEVGNVAAVDVEKTSLERPIVALGARGAFKISESIRITASAAEQFTRGSTLDRDVTLRSINREFNVNGPTIDGNSLVYDAGIEGRFGKLQVGLSYVGERSKSYDSDAVRATLGLRF